MPELPEVEVVRRGLATHVVGRQIAQATLSGTRVARRHLPGPEDLSVRLQDRRILAADRRGKYLWLVVEAPGGDREALILHLGMSGQLLVSPADSERQRHLHAVVDFADAGPQLRFVDQRTFGGLLLADLDPQLSTPEHPYGVPDVIAHIAPDPLESAFDSDAVIAKIKSRRSGIKRSLLDQSLVSGIGNIYADESLWRARLHGERSGDKLTKPAIRRTLEHAREVMLEALEQGGTSFDALYVNVNGQSGYFDRSLDAYGQAGRPCARCGTPIRRESFMNRSSFSCPRCQQAPRRPQV